MRDPRGPHSPRWALWLALIVLLLAITSKVEGQGQQRLPRLQRCEVPPRFSVNGEEPMTLARGHVTLVALLTSTCSFCIRQAQSLETLHSAYLANNTDVRMMIINGGPHPDPDEEGEGVFERTVSFDVYHDDSRHTMWSQVFRGGKDDILIFNRCGKMTYHLPFPYSYLGYSYVTRAISSTISSTELCRCQDAVQARRKRMVGDDPSRGLSERRGRGRNHQGQLGMLQDRRRQPQGQEGVTVYQEAGNRSSQLNPRSRAHHRCPQRDEVCRQLKRERLRYSQFLEEHGLDRQHNGVNEEEILRMFGYSGGGPAL